MVWQDSHHDLPVKTSSINQTTKVWADTLSYSAKLWAHIFVLRLRQGSSQYGAAIYESSSELLYTKGRSELPWYWFIYDTKVDAIHMKWTPRILDHSQSLNLGVFYMITEMSGMLSPNVSNGWLNWFSVYVVGWGDVKGQKVSPSLFFKSKLKVSTEPLSFSFSSSFFLLIQYKATSREILLFLFFNCFIFFLICQCTYYINLIWSIDCYFINPPPHFCRLFFWLSSLDN